MDPVSSSMKIRKPSIGTGWLDYIAIKTARKTNNSALLEHKKVKQSRYLPCRR
jgi:hypothetical protein